MWDVKVLNIMNPIVCIITLFERSKLDVTKIRFYRSTEELFLGELVFLYSQKRNVSSINFTT